MAEKRFAKWKPPVFDKKDMTKWNWMCQHHNNLKLGNRVDIGAFTYINAKKGVELGDFVQIGSHCSLYSVSTIDKKEGKILLKKNCRVGSHSVVMPGVTIGENAIIGAFSFVNTDIPENTLALGVPVKIIRKLTKKEIEQ
jgi:acetyltransferase-like isoleucine patch superfamily enzyme